MPSARALRAGRAVIELSLVDGPIQKQLRKLEHRFRSFGRSLSKLGTLGVAGGGLAGLQNLFIGGVATAALAWPIKLAANFERASAMLASFVGDAEQARQMMRELEQFAVVTPFNVTELTNAAQKLMSFGVTADRVMPSLRALGEIVGGDTERLFFMSKAFGDTAAKGRITGEEVRQFVNSGFNPLQEIARTMGDDMGTLEERMRLVQKRMESGEVSFEEIANALVTATSAGGRFHGLLKAIRNTASGQFQELREKIGLAVRPLGEELLPAITQLLKRVNSFMDPLREWIKANSDVAKTVAVVVLSVAGLMGSLIGLGVTLQILAFAAGGINMIFTTIGTALSLMLTPIGAIVAALAGLAIWFATSTDAGRQMVEEVATVFHRLGQIAADTFGGIVNALTAGEFELAGRVAMAGLNLAWMEGTNKIMETWIKFKGGVLAVFTEIRFGVEKIWTKLIFELSRRLGKFMKTVEGTGDLFSTMFEMIGQTPTKRAGEMLRLAQREAARRDKGEKEQAALDTAESVALASLEGQRQEEQTKQHLKSLEALESQRRAVEDARRELERLTGEAQKAADEEARKREEQVRGQIKPFADSAANAALAKSQSTFDVRLAPQIFGGMNIWRQQLTQLKKIADNTEPGVGGTHHLLPVGFS